MIFKGELVSPIFHLFLQPHGRIRVLHGLLGAIRCLCLNAVVSYGYMLTEKEVEMRKSGVERERMRTVDP